MIAVVIDERQCSAAVSFWHQVKQTTATGIRVRMRPTPIGGFDLVKNGSAFLATDFDGMPIGTYPTVSNAIDAWRAMRRPAHG